MSKEEKCDKCNKLIDDGKKQGEWVYWVVSQCEIINQYGIDAPNYDKEVGHWDDDCWKEVGEQYKKNPIVWKGKFGNYTKYSIERHEYSRKGVIGGGSSKELWWDNKTNQWTTKMPVDNDNSRERERERETNFTITNSDCWIRSSC